VPGEPPERWGFHRLSASWAQRLVASAGIRPGDLVLDIGAGDGVLTRALVDAGASVVAFELHAKRARALREVFARERVTVVQADVTDLRLPRRPFRVVSNPPFAVSAAVLTRLLAPGSRLETGDLLLPLHVAQRYARHDVRGAGRWGATVDLFVRERVPRSAFRPPPPNAVAVLRIERRATRNAPARARTRVRSPRRGSNAVRRGSLS